MKGLKTYGWVGIGLVLFAETTLFLHWRGFEFVHGLSAWTTPFCWAGYLLFIDSVIYRIKGHSLIYNRRKEFFVQLPLSILFWVIFEVYNFHLHNWEYIGLPQNNLVLCIGMAIAFATIMPGLFLTSELIETLNVFDKFKIAKLKVDNRIVYGSIVIGFLFIMFPLLLKGSIAKYLFGLVWTGFLLIFDPIVYASKGDSLLKDLEDGKLNRILSLFSGGLVCGLLWEFWNYWSATKWVYTAPFTHDIKIFEMPIIGFIGFAPFAWEYFAFYSFCKLFVKKD
ncbi:MAG: hypothetical protein ACUZ8E_10715 [Candidatus Anammoxibacter sp.]